MNINGTSTTMNLAEYRNVHLRREVVVSEHPPPPPLSATVYDSTVSISLLSAVQKIKTTTVSIEMLLTGLK